MARKNYSEEFRRDAVELYRVTEGATITGIAADLGITDATLGTWVKAAGVAVRHGRLAGAAAPPGGGDEVARLRARVAELEARERVLSTEKDILRAAAKYFAGETNW
jgi:transposase